MSFVRTGTIEEARLLLRYETAYQKYYSRLPNKEKHFGKTVNERVCLLLASIAAFISPFANAWDGAVQGRIALIESTPSPSFSFRVSLQGYPAMCANGPAWAYLETADTNYSALVAALLASKATGDTLIVYTNRDASGYCKIGHVISYAQ